MQFIAGVFRFKCKLLFSFFTWLVGVVVVVLCVGVVPLRTCGFVPSDFWLFEFWEDPRSVLTGGFWGTIKCWKANSREFQLFCNSLIANEAWKWKIIQRDYENNVTYRVQLFEKIFILWDNCSSITVQFGEYCCQSKMRNQGSADRDIIWLSRYLLELCLFLFTNKFADIFLRIPGKSNVLSHTRPFNSKIKKYFNLLLK